MHLKKNLNEKYDYIPFRFFSVKYSLPVIIPDEFNNDRYRLLTSISRFPVGYVNSTLASVINNSRFIVARHKS